MGCARLLSVPFPIYLVVSFAIVAFERSDHYLGGACATAVAMLVLACGLVLPGVGPLRLVERWAAGDGVDAATALEATYTWAVAPSPEGWRSSLCVRSCCRSSSAS